MSGLTPGAERRARALPAPAARWRPRARPSRSSRPPRHPRPPPQAPSPQSPGLQLQETGWSPQEPVCHPGPRDLLLLHLLQREGQHRWVLGARAGGGGGRTGGGGGWGRRGGSGLPGWDGRQEGPALRPLVCGLGRTPWGSVSVGAGLTLELGFDARGVTPAAAPLPPVCALRRRSSPEAL